MVSVCHFTILTDNLGTQTAVKEIPTNIVDWNGLKIEVINFEYIHKYGKEYCSLDGRKCGIIIRCCYFTTFFS